MLGRLKALGEFAYDFVVGDDWLIAVGVVIALAITYAVSHATKAAVWWLVPVALLVLLPLSLRRALRKR